MLKSKKQVNILAIGKVDSEYAERNLRPQDSKPCDSAAESLASFSVEVRRGKGSHAD
jgi:hypothetical protein